MVNISYTAKNLLVLCSIPLITMTSRLIQLKSLLDYTSPLGTLLSVIATYGTAFLLLHPTFKEALVIQAVDLALILVIRPMELALFERRYPDVKPYFRKIDWNALEKLTQPERATLIQSMMAFPKRRAAHCHELTFLKNIPLIFIAVFYWKHSISNFEQFMFALGIVLVTAAYFYGAIFLETHFLLSKHIEEIHRKLDFSNTFREVELRYSKNELAFQDASVLILLIFFVLALQTTVAMSATNFDPIGLALRLNAIGAVGMILFGHLWLLGRRLLVGSLEQLFQQMNHRESRNHQLIILESCAKS